MTLVAAALARAAERLPPRGLWRSLLPVVVLLGLGALTWRQAGVYRDEETLWRDTLEKNPASAIAASNLARVLMRKGRVEEAIGLLREAVRLAPRSAEAHANLATALSASGRRAEAIEAAAEASRLAPGDPRIREPVDSIPTPAP